MTDLEIMNWLEKKDSPQAYIKCVKRRIAACVRKQGAEFPGLKYLNSPPVKELECKKCGREKNKPGEKDYKCPAIHAELKAIRSVFLVVGPRGDFGNLIIGNYDLFVTHFPCKNCALLSIYLGIKNIFYRYEYYNSGEEQGREIIECVRSFLEKGKVGLFKI